VAGKIDWSRLRGSAERLLGDWAGAAPELPTGPDTRARVSQLIEPIEQTHIGLAFESVPFEHPDYYLVAIAVRVLSGGMGARLFTEVREKRGLCYSVSASYHTLRGRGAVIAYANPEPPKAQETLDVLVAELRRMASGIERAELDRAKTGVKARLVMSAESSRARAGIIAGDWFHLGRVRPMEEVLSAIDGITLERINGFLKANPAGKFTLVTLGAKELEVKGLE
jgi:predicted Zn-dependent peptidase